MTQRMRAESAPELRRLRGLAGLSQSDLAAATGYSEKTIRRWELGEGVARSAVLEYLKTVLSSAPRGVDSPVPSFTFADLFAGIGGMRKGFEDVGGNCVFTSEWDKYAQLTYAANFRDGHQIAGDITKIAAEDIPPHDVLLAGFPCQPFSIAGVSKMNALGRPHGFACDTKGTLFFDVARIIEHHRPRAFLLENVKNLVTHDGKRTFSTIIRTLEDELGYHVSARVIDAKGFVPQHRERILIAGFRDANAFSWDDLDLPRAASGPRLNAILHPEDGTELPELPYTDESGRVADKYYLTDHLWNYLQEYAARHREKGNGFGFGLVGPNDVARTLSARYYKDGSEILVQTDRRTPRRLTPRECARLMGFDSETARFRIPVSDTQAYKQFGNSVVVPMIRAVARQMLPYLSLHEEAQLRLRLKTA
jgi:DNA (cytosine-5)-methyltransferase 1